MRSTANDENLEVLSIAARVSQSLWKSTGKVVAC